MLSNSEREDLLQTAKRAAQLAAAVHRSAHDYGFELNTKQSQSDLVTSVDRESERIIVEEIRRARPRDTILGEEGAAIHGDSGVCWIIDPLDGTTNFVHKYPAHSVAIGVEVDGVRALGVVHDTFHDLIYEGVVGKGALRAQERIRTGAQQNLEQALIGTGFSPITEVRIKQTTALQHLLPQVRDVRRSGCPSLDICLVAAGMLDAFYESGLGRWDICAAAAIAEAAGATVTEFDSGFFSQRVVVVANAELCEKLVNLIGSIQ